MKLIPLTKGRFAIVDDVDFDRVNEFKWHTREKQKGSPIVYAVREINFGGGKRIFQRMHHFILGVESSQKIDHRDGDGLNNMRGNIRPCTNQQNSANQSLRDCNTSGFKGVSWCEPMKGWRARIKTNRKEICFGPYQQPHQAAVLYDFFAISMFGDFAKTNYQMGLLCH